jgi:hypothetical protein
MYFIVLMIIKTRPARQIALVFATASRNNATRKYAG